MFSFTQWAFLLNFSLFWLVDLNLPLVEEVPVGEDRDDGDL